MSWNRNPKELGEFLLTYRPIIDFLKAGGSFEDSECGLDYQASVGVIFQDRYSKTPTHPLLVKLYKECQQRFGKDVHVYFGGARDLKVAEVTGQVKISEYDGFESYHLRGDDEDEWL